MWPACVVIRDCAEGVRCDDRRVRYRGHRIPDTTGTFRFTAARFAPCPVRTPHHGGGSGQGEDHDSRREARRRRRHRARRRDRHRGRTPRRKDGRRRVVRGGERDASRHGAPRARVLPRGGRRRDRHQHVLGLPARARRRRPRRRDGGRQPARGRARARGAGSGGARPAGGGRRLHVERAGVASGNRGPRPRLSPDTREGGGELPGDGRYPCRSGVRPAGDGDDDGRGAREPGNGGGAVHRSAGVGGNQRQSKPRGRDGRLGHRERGADPPSPTATSLRRRSRSRRSSTRWLRSAPGSSESCTARSSPPGRGWKSSSSDGTGP